MALRGILTKALHIESFSSCNVLLRSSVGFMSVHTCYPQTYGYLALKKVMCCRKGQRTYKIQRRSPCTITMIYPQSRKTFEVPIHQNFEMRCYSSATSTAYGILEISQYQASQLARLGLIHCYRTVPRRSLPLTGLVSNYVVSCQPLPASAINHIVITTPFVRCSVFLDLLSTEKRTIQS